MGGEFQQARCRRARVALFEATRSSSARTRRCIAAGTASRPISRRCRDGIRPPFNSPTSVTAQVGSDLINMAGTASFDVDEGAPTAVGQDHLGDRARRRRLENRQPSRVVEGAADLAAVLIHAAGTVSNSRRSRRHRAGAHRPSIIGPAVIGAGIVERPRRAVIVDAPVPRRIGQQIVGNDRRLIFGPSRRRRPQAADGSAKIAPSRLWVDRSAASAVIAPAASAKTADENGKHDPVRHGRAPIDSGILAQAPLVIVNGILHPFR